MVKVLKAVGDFVADAIIHLFFGAVITAIAWGPLLLIAFFVDATASDVIIILGVFSILGALVLLSAPDAP